MAKARDAFRTISEVAEAMDLPPHVLRFWESKFSQIRPVKRAGGRRYYRPDDVALLFGIRTLLHDQGLSIKGAQRHIREEGVRAIMALGETAAADDTRPAQSPAEDAATPVPASVPAPAPDHPPASVPSVEWQLSLFGDEPEPQPAPPPPPRAIRFAALADLGRVRAESKLLRPILDRLQAARPS